MKTATRLAIAILFIHVPSAGQGQLLPAIGVSADCGGYANLFPGLDTPVGTGVQRVYEGDVAECTLWARLTRDVDEPPACVGGVGHFLDATQFRLLSGPEPPMERLQRYSFAMWWEAVDERAVDVQIELTPMPPLASGGFPRRSIMIRGLAALPPGDYRLVAFHDAAALATCVPDLPEGFVKESRRPAVLVVGPPRPGADRLQWLHTSAVQDLRAGRPEAAIVHALELVALRPESAYGYGILGRAQKAAGDCASAVSSLRSALRLADLPADERDPGLNIVAIGRPDGPRHHWRDLIAECEEDE